MTTEAQAALDRGDLVDDAAVETPEAAATEAAEDPAVETEAAEAEGEAPAEAKAEEGKEVPAAKEDKKEPAIPKSRLDQVLKRNRELEAQLAAQREAQQPVNLADLNKQLDDLEEERDNALLDADRDKAKDLAKKIRALNEKITDTKVAKAQESSRAGQQVNAVYDEAVRQVEEMYPALNPDNDAFSAEALEYGGILLRGLVSAGNSHVEAMVTAAELTALKFGLHKTGDKPDADRKATAVAKAVATAKKQPPSTGKVGEAHDVAGGALTAESVAAMSRKDFENLAEKSPKVLAALRGDNFA